MRRIDLFDKYMKYKGLNDNKVTVDLGISVDTIGKSRKDGRDLSDKVTEQILNFYTDINRIWLLTGEGEMIKQPVRQMSNGDNNTQIAGNNNQINIPTTIDKVIDEIAEQRKLVAKSQEQIDRLLSLLERNRRHGQEQQEQ